MLSDALHALTLLRRSRWLTSGALLTFAFGVGVNVAAFAVVDRVLFEPLPYRDPQGLLTIHATNRFDNQVYFSFPKVLALAIRDGLEPIADVAYAGRSRQFASDDFDPPLRFVDASYNLLDVLGVQTVMGRAFTRSDARERRPLVLLTNGAWRSRFGASPTVVGRTMVHATGILEIVGVLPSRFIIPSVNWASPADGLVLSEDLLETATARESVPGLVARLRTSVRASTIQTQINEMVSGMQANGPADVRSFVRVEPIQRGLFWNVRGSLQTLFIAGLLVWLVACVNLGVLLATRQQSRRQETAIRASLGASRLAVLRLTVIEVVFLCIAGSVVALICLQLTIAGVRLSLPTAFQPLMSNTVDARLLGVLVLACVAGILLAAIPPAWAVGHLDPQEALRRAGVTGAPRRRGRALLLVLETTLGTCLVMAGSLAVRSFTDLMSRDLGYAAAGLHLVRIQGPASAAARPSGNGSSSGPTGSAGPSSPPPGADGGARVEDQPRGGDQSPLTNPAGTYHSLSILRSHPAVEYASCVDAPVVGGEVADVVSDEGGRQLVRRTVADDYFSVMQTPIVAGRPFSATELQTEAAVVMLSERAAQVLWPQAPTVQAIGRVVRFDGGTSYEVIGVVADTRARQSMPVQPELFRPWPFGDGPCPAHLIRVRRGATVDANSLRAAVRGVLGADTRVTVVPATRYIEPWLQDPRLYASVFGSFGSIALLLCAVGLFAVAGFDASLRRQEVGVRLALGASRAQIVRLLILQATKPVVVGLLFGFAVSLWAVQFLQAVLHGVHGIDRTMYLVVGCTLLGTGAAAAWYPARMASRADPMSALRVEGDR